MNLTPKQKELLKTLIRIHCVKGKSVGAKEIADELHKRKVKQDGEGDVAALEADVQEEPIVEKSGYVQAIERSIEERVEEIIKKEDEVESEKEKKKPKKRVAKKVAKEDEIESRKVVERAKEIIDDEHAAEEKRSQDIGRIFPSRIPYRRSY